MKEKLVRLCARGDLAINLRGMEYMQARTGESEDTAWKRMRGKLGTGKHLDETYVLPLQPEPKTDGVSQPPQPPVSDQEPLPEPPKDPDVKAPPGGSIFGNKPTSTFGTLGATSALNLLGKVESWGISTGTHVQDVQLKVATLTGAQLTDLLKKLPDGITYELTLNKEEK